MYIERPSFDELRLVTNTMPVIRPLTLLNLLCFGKKKELGVSLQPVSSELALKAQWHMISSPIFPQALFPLHDPMVEEVGKRSS